MWRFCALVQVFVERYALALYDNEDTEHEEEVKFKEGEAICLTARVSDDWLEGYVFTDSTKRVGIFPLAFVEVSGRCTEDVAIVSLTSLFDPALQVIVDLDED